MNWVGPWTTMMVHLLFYFV